MSKFENSQLPNEDEDKNLPDGVPDGAPDFLKEDDGIPDFMKDAINGIAERFGMPAGAIAIPLGSIPHVIRDKLCELCPKMKHEDVAELDINELEEWNSINAELDRLQELMKKVDKEMDKIHTRRTLLCSNLELRHNVSGEKLRIENGKLTRRFCDKEADDKCNIN